jgi:hypothetical protein
LLPESRGWHSQVAAINTAVAALCMTAGVFPKERSIVDRERAKGSYSLGPYLLSKLMAETPIRAAFSLLFGVVLYPMAQLHPTLVRLVSFFSLFELYSLSQFSISFHFILLAFWVVD